MIKLIAVDIDGTLLDSNYKLRKKVKRKVCEAVKKGLKVVICTGRALEGTKQLLDTFHLDHQDDQYVICYGGAMIRSTNGEVIYQKGITYDNFCDLEMLARKKNLHFHALGLDRIYTCNRDIGRYTLHEANLVKLPISYRTPEELRNVQLIKAMYIDEPDVLDKGIGDRKDFDSYTQFEFMKTAPFYFEVYARGVNKGQALKNLCEKLDISPEEVMAIGNEENDIPMIKYAGSGVAMGNSTPEVIEVADIVVSDCDNDGVAEAINKVIKYL